MNRKKINLIIHNMELLIRSLKEEMREFPDVKYEEVAPYLMDQDIEFYEEED
jgi:uncharacterized LabA/DUF88 family protein